MSNMLRTINLKTTDLATQEHKKYKLAILDKLLDKNKDLAPQGSKEWLADRTFNIGGSEMSVITKENPYTKLDQLVAQKVGFTKFNGNIATRWGKLFEDNTTRLCEILMSIENGVSETGSLEGCVPNQKYSPDGLAVIKMLCLESDELGEAFESYQYCIVLFEFKSPYSAIPDGLVPKHYKPQPKTGLCSIPIADFSIFVNNMFRKCSFQQLNEFIGYDTTFHDKDEKKNADKHKPLAFGMLLFYQTKAQKKKFYKTYKTSITYVEPTYETDTEDSDSDDNFFNQSKKKPKPHMNNATNCTLHKYIYSHYSKDKTQRHAIRDFGKSYYRNFNDILQLYELGFFSIKYCTPHILAEYNKNDFLMEQNISIGSDDCKDTIKNYNAIIDSKTAVTEKGDRPLIGYLPWKLFKSDIIYMPRDPNYVNNYADDIQTAVNMIKDIMSKETEEEKTALFKKIFPKSRVLKNCGRDNVANMQFLPNMN